MSKNKLTAKQEMFCREYIIDFNGTRAAIAAGYSQKAAKEQASENLTKPNIQQYIQELQTKRNEKLEIDAEWVLKKAVELHEICVDVGDNSVAARSLEIVGKHVDIQAFREKKEIGVTDDLKDTLDKMSDKQLASKLAFVLASGLGE